MQSNPTMEIVLNGYTDNTGRPVSLVALSMDRVGSVRAYMIDKGIAGKRITGKGYGPENPVVKHDTEEHWRMSGVMNPRSRKNKKDLFISFAVHIAP
jgi:outer membrane protein OmpA-like peptidoglycan-associated protein